MKRTTLMSGLILLVAASSSYAQNIQTTVNGKYVYFNDVQPMMKNGRVLVPLRGVFEEMGATVHWNSMTSTATATNGVDVVKLRLGDQFAVANGRTVALDEPARTFNNRIMVPLRFVSESLGAVVDWNAQTMTASIITAQVHSSTNLPPTTRMVTFNSGTVIPFRLNTPLSSNTSRVGDLFTASLDAYGNTDYSDLPNGTLLMGHVDTVKAKSSASPGVLGLEFDRIKLPNGRTYVVDGSLISLDGKNVETKDGKLVAKVGAKSDLKYVGIGAGAGILVALATKGNLLTSTLIGAALGFLYDEIKKDPSKSTNVTLEPGTTFGMRLDSDLVFNANIGSSK